MRRAVKSPQVGLRIMAFRIDGSAVAGGTATTNGILQGKYHATVTENSSGNYTFTFNEPFQQIPCVTFGTATDVTTLRIVDVTTSTVQVEQVGADQTTPEADADFHMLVVGFDYADQT